MSLSNPVPPHGESPEKKMIHMMSMDLVSAMLGEPSQSIGAKRNGTYYQLHFAEELLPILDAMTEDKQDRMYRYAKFPHLAKNSLFLKVSQAFQYAVDHLDDKEKRLMKMREELVIRKESAGVAIRWRTNIRDPLGEPDIILPEGETLSWKQKLDLFLSNEPDGSKFHEKGLSLSEDEINDLKISLHGLQGIVASIKSSEIKVLKLSAEEQKEL